jgi:glycerol-3-phosphate dehydrogenase subunit B
LTPRVVVVGCGIAGTAAALAARAGGARVTLLDGGTGASTLAPGALDLASWEEASGDEDGSPLSEPPVAAVMGALDAFVLPENPAIVATTAGALRHARGIDRSLLDMSGLPSGVVVVPRAAHPSWDAGTLARSWNDTKIARERGLEFVAVDATLTRFIDERHATDPDIAARHDDPARLEWLAARVREAASRAGVGRISAAILPPWLGLAHSRALGLSEAVGLPCGEAMSGPGGPSGLRFEHARDRAMGRAAISVIVARVSEVMRESEGWRVVAERGVAFDADCVVLATGGLIGGGIAYTPSASILAGELPARARETFCSTIEAPLPIGVGGRALPLPGSLFGESPESLAWPFTRGASMLERVGALASRNGHVENGLYVAGDLVADRPRTWLWALVSGARAGAACARHDA